MKRILVFCLTICLIAAGAGCSQPQPVSPSASESSAPEAASSISETPAEPVAEPAPVKQKGETISTNDIDPDAGADSYAGVGDNAGSRYFVNPDFYRAQSDDMLTILAGYKTYQQTAEWSCGNVAALTALVHLGIDTYTETDIAKAMGSHTDKDTSGAEIGSADGFYEYGTNIEQLTVFFQNVPGLKVLETSYRESYAEADLLTAESGVTPNSEGNLPGTFSAMSLYTSDNDDASENYVEDAKDSYFVKWLTGHIQKGNVIMAEWAEWDGHWVNIIGYDNNGTPGIGDDVLIFADSYDTFDHWQDGYSVMPLEPWFYQWNDRNIAPKPFQLQPYLVVGKE